MAFMEQNNVLAKSLEVSSTQLAESRQDNVNTSYTGKEEDVKDLMLELDTSRVREQALVAELDAPRKTVVLMEEHNCFLIKSLAGAGTRLAESDEEKLKTQSIQDSNALRERMGLMVAESDALRKEMDMLVQQNCFLTKERDDARKAHEELASQINFLIQEPLNV
jgi:hypothetical protein